MVFNKHSNHLVRPSVVFFGMLTIVACILFVSVNLAFASSTGKIKIDSSHDVSFKGYQIFYADITADEKVTNISWTENSDLKNAVVSYLSDTGCTNPENANDACNFIKEKINQDSFIEGTKIATKDSFAGALANKILAVVPAIDPSATLAANDEYSLNQGYWLFVSDDETIEEGQNGSAPIWISVSAKNKELQEKSAGLTFEKHIIVDEESKSVAEVFGKQEVQFEIVASLPSNFAAFPHYYMLFTDNLPAGLDLVGDSPISIFDNEDDITPTPENQQIIIARNTDNFTVEFKDMAVGSHSFTKDSDIKIKYKTSLNASGVLGGLGNVNSAELTFTNDPVNLSRTNAVSENNSAAVYSYKFKLNLYDGNITKSEEKIPLDGGFYIIDKKSGLYIQADGSLAETSYEFQTGTDGTFEVKNIATGAFSIIENTVPEDYSKPEEDLQLTIEPTYEGLSLNNIDAKISGGYNRPIFGQWYENDVNDRSIEDGHITLNVYNKSVSYLLPVTGMLGIAIPVILGIVLIVVSVFGIRKLYKKAR